MSLVLPLLILPLHFVSLPPPRVWPRLTTVAVGPPGSPDFDPTQSGQLSRHPCCPAGPHEAVLPRERVGLLCPAPKNSPALAPWAVPRLLDVTPQCPARSHAPPARRPGHQALSVMVLSVTVICRPCPALKGFPGKLSRKCFPTSLPSVRQQHDPSSLRPCFSSSTEQRLRLPQGQTDGLVFLPLVIEQTAGCGGGRGRHASESRRPEPEPRLCRSPAE